jgi:hypothetical protein
MNNRGGYTPRSPKYLSTFFSQVSNVGLWVCQGSTACLANQGHMQEISLPSSRPPPVQVAVLSSAAKLFCLLRLDNLE